ncbi:MAG: hypothetical protein M3O03_00900 [Pseudomonadota bacterium]|nr:hypothetical protein [Pseudomonadota bacterium]
MLAFSPAFSQADNPISLYDHDRLIKEYLKDAFSLQKQTLLKFTTWPIPTEITCEGLQQQDCRQGIDAVNQAVHVGISFNLDFKTKPTQLEFQFVPAEAVEERSAADSKLFAGGFMDKSDPDCQVFYSLRGSEIIDAKLLVSVGQASLRKRLCIQVQLFKAMGLHAFGDETFAEQWVHKPLGVQDSTEADFGPGVHSYFIIEAIHACPQLHPGMKIDEARESLHADETCLAKFTTPEK